MQKPIKQHIGNGSVWGYLDKTRKQQKPYCCDEETEQWDKRKRNQAHLSSKNINEKPVYKQV